MLLLLIITVESKSNNNDKNDNNNNNVDAADVAVVLLWLLVVHPAGMRRNLLAKKLDPGILVSFVLVIVIVIVIVTVIANVVVIILSLSHVSSAPNAKNVTLTERGVFISDSAASYRALVWYMSMAWRTAGILFIPFP